MKASFQAAMIAAVMLVAPSCGFHPGPDVANLQALWRSGDTAGAILEARAVLRRYCEANDATWEDIAAHAERARHRLSTQPVVPADGGAPVAPGLDVATDHLDRELRDALGHGSALVTIRAAVTVGELGLARHTSGLLTLIATSRPLGSDSSSLEIDDPVTAWLTSKMVALWALERLAKRGGR